MASMKEMIARYNAAASVVQEAPVNRFSDIKTAERRVTAIEEKARHEREEEAALPVATAISGREAAAAELAKEVTIIAPALAHGAEGKASVHSRRSLEQQKGKTAPSPAINDIAPDAGTGIINRMGRVVLKGNKEVRAALKGAAKLAGGSRLTPHGFADFSAFLNGFAVEADRTTQIVFDVAGQTDKTVTLTIAKDGSWVVQ